MDHQVDLNNQVVEPAQGQGNPSQQVNKIESIQMEMASTESKTSSKSMEEPEVLFIHECKENTSQTAWYETLTVEGNKVKFKLDCGAEISILPYKCFNPTLRNVLNLGHHFILRIKPLSTFK